MAAVLIQADDFSGAAEVAQCFAQYGFRTRILLEPSFGEAAMPEASDVVVVDTHSRSSSPEEAAAAVARAFAGQEVAGARVLFKKIDSLWRGNVGAEVGALTGLGHHVLVAGALPQLRRTVVDGRPYADGVPLAETALWKAEAATPPSHLSEVFGQSAGSGAAAALHTLDLAAVRSFHLAARLGQLFSGGAATRVVADGETEADLEAVVEALTRLGFTAGGRQIVLVGTGGIADVLAKSLRADFAHNAQLSAPVPSSQRLPGSGAARPVLAVVGSASEAARRQLRELQAGSFRLVGLTPDDLRQRTTAPKLSTVREALAAGEPVVLTVTAEQVDPRETGEIVRNLAHFVSAAIDTGVSGATLPHLILTGGETAREVLDTLGIRTLEPLEAVQHGAVVSLADDGRLVGTKPGSFGDDQALLQLYSAIHGRRSADPAGRTNQNPSTLPNPLEKQ